MMIPKASVADPVTPLPTANDIVASGQFSDPVRYFRRIEKLLAESQADQAIVEAYSQHLASCAACARVGVCRQGLEIILPPQALDWLKEHAEREPDTLELVMTRKSNEELAAIVDEGGPGSSGRWYATAERILMARMS